MDELQRIEKLQNEIKQLKEKIKTLESPELPKGILSNTYLAKDVWGILRLLKGTPPEDHITPFVETTISKKDYENKKYDEKTISRLRFPNGNIIFRQGYIIDPNSLEGRIIQHNLANQKDTKIENQKQREKRWKINAMNGEEAKEFMRNLKKQ